MHHYLIEQLFGKRSLAASRSANQQVKPGKHTVECAAEVRKSWFPTGDLLYVALSLKVVQKCFQLFAFGLQLLLLAHNSTFDIIDFIRSEQGAFFR